MTDTPLSITDKGEVVAALADVTTVTPLEPLPTSTNRKQAMSFMTEAVLGVIVIGSRKSVLDKVNQLFPLQKKDPARAAEKYFYADITFEDQLEKLLKYNKYRDSEYVFGILYFHENVPEPLPEVLKNMPPEIREFRIVRVEVHNK